MSHSWHCLWKQKFLSEKLKRQVTLTEVHMICDELGFTDPQDTIDFLERASAEEIEAILARAKRKRRYMSEAEAYRYAYIG